MKRTRSQVVLGVATVALGLASWASAQNAVSSKGQETSESRKEGQPGAAKKASHRKSKPFARIKLHDLGQTPGTGASASPGNANKNAVAVSTGPAIAAAPKDGKKGSPGAAAPKDAKQAPAKSSGKRDHNGAPR